MNGVVTLDKNLLAAMEDGLPVVSRPYAEVARRIGTSETEVMTRLQRLLDEGVIRRIGLIVRHRSLGFVANAMVVWDIPDAHVDAVAKRLSEHPFVTLCYRRPRRLPQWPYNLFCMVHGRDRQTVVDQIATLNTNAGLAGVPNAVLFSKRCFKQRGARFSKSNMEEAS